MATFNNTTKKTTYDSETTYAVDETCFYGGLKYKCILESTDNLPTNETYWTVDVLYTNLDKS